MIFFDKKHYLCRKISVEMKKILIINGPNLNLLGKREPSVYGSESFEQYLETLKNEFADRAAIDYFQSNSEGEIIDKLHNADLSADGIILNAGGYTHTSVAIADAVAAISAPVVEVHISNVFKREEFRHYSYLSPVCAGVIAGFKLKSYKLALQSLID